MNKWLTRRKAGLKVSPMFSPFSKQAKKWEPHAQKLRLMAECGPNDLLDPYQLAPKLQLAVMDGDEVFRLLPAELQSYLRYNASDHWSGGVLPHPLPDGTFLCILNQIGRASCRERV